MRDERRWWGAGVSLLSLILALVRLGQGGLWEDEGVTGLLGAHILKHGLPHVRDGIMLISILPGDSRGGVWCWDGWLQAYLSAAGEAIFGRTSLGARFFHAVCGALIPWASYPLFRAMARQRFVPEAAALLLGLSVPLLVYARQAHYYPEAILLTVLMTRCYVGVLDARRGAAFGLAACSFLLFHAFYANMVLIWMMLGFHLLLVRPPLRVLARMAGAGAASVALIAPFAIWARIWDRNFQIPETKTFELFLARLRHYVLELNIHLAPLLLLLLVAAVVARRKRRPAVAVACGAGAVLFPTLIGGPSTPIMLWLFGVAAAFTFAAGLPLFAEAVRRASEPWWKPEVLVTTLIVGWILAWAWLAPYPFLRYLTPIFPFLAYVVAASAFAIVPGARGGVLGWVIVAVVIVCNVLSVWPIAYAAGPITLRHFVAALPGSARFEASRFFPRASFRTFDDGFFVEVWVPEDPPRLDLRAPLLEYLGEITHDFRGPVDAIADHLNGLKRPGDRFYTWNDALPIAYHTGLAPYLEPPREPPRWVIPRAGRPLTLGRARAMTAGRNYREIELDAVDTYYQNREEPDLHRFRSAEIGDRARVLERMGE